MLNIHVVSHTHWDREWYLTYEQFRFRLVALVDRLLDLLDRDPSYRHFHLDGQTIVLEDYLEIRPEQEARLRRATAFRASSARRCRSATCRICSATSARCHKSGGSWASTTPFCGAASAAPTP